MSEEQKSERQKHLDWCKQRAFQYCDAGDPQQAFASFASDVRKHPSTEDIIETITMLGTPLLMGGHLDTAEKMREHIDGYN